MYYTFRSSLAVVKENGEEYKTEGLCIFEGVAGLCTLLLL